MVMFPGVLAIQDDGDQDVVMRRVHHDLPDAAQDVIGAGFRGGFVVHEAEGVGDLAVAKHDHGLLACRPGAIGAIELGLPAPRLL